MPTGNDFQHTPYVRSDPGDRVDYREYQVGAPPDSPAWLDAMGQHGTQLARAGVRAVILLHGTFLNTDLFGTERLDEAGGLKRGYSRGIPGIDALLALMREGTNGLPTSQNGQKPPFQDDDQTKKLIDEKSGDAGNFTAAYIDLFRKAINQNDPSSLVCTRIVWSCEHHHVGRAHAAFRLLGQLRTICDDLKLGPKDHILMQAHGQAGLVLALVSNLLARDALPGRERFIHLLQSSVTRDISENIRHIDSWLQDGKPLNGATLDVVTFGTPVRYGWDPTGIGKLLHIVNHRPMRIDGKRWLAKMELPQITMEMPIAWGGDYVQQLAVAGTDAVPSSPEAKDANKAFWELLEPFDGFERWLECARKSVRCQADGQCLLINYKDAGSNNPRDHIYGHAAYTRVNTMLFNTMEIVKSLYSGSTVS